MRETEFCRKYAEFENSLKRTVLYCLLSECGENGGWGVRIRIAETGERRDAADLTQHRAEAERLLDMMATGLVTPSTMADVVEDWFGR